MNNYIYSPSVNAFYPCDLMEFYVNAGSWPADSLAVDDSVFYEFTAPPPAGKVRVAGNDGFPTWGNISPPAYSELVAIAENKKEGLLILAKNIISLWQTELQLGIISDVNKASLIAWMKYIQNLQNTDTSLAPDIDWPTRPE